MEREEPHSAEALDDLLVLAAQDGSPSAMSELFRRWEGRLLRHAVHLTGSREGAADVSQEVWLAIVRGIGGLDDPGRFPAWAHRIVKNKSADWIRRRRRDRDTSEALGAEPAGREADDTAEEIGALRRALRKLPADRRTLLSLRYVDGVSVQQIAELLRVPAGTVKSRLYHAREELRSVTEADRGGAAAQRPEGSRPDRGGSDG